MLCVVPCSSDPCPPGSLTFSGMSATVLACGEDCTLVPPVSHQYPLPRQHGRGLAHPPKPCPELPNKGLGGGAGLSRPFMLGQALANLPGNPLMVASLPFPTSFYPVTCWPSQFCCWWHYWVGQPNSSRAILLDTAGVTVWPNRGQGCWGWSGTAVWLILVLERSTETIVPLWLARKPTSNGLSSQAATVKVEVGLPPPDMLVS